jgi:microcystin-dependent protein
MCNGQNGTPDLRGRVAVGATNTPCAVPCPSDTLPGSNGNPTYNKGDATGSNTVVLSLPQIPTHNHTGSSAITTISPATHSHFTVGGSQGNTLTSSNTISQGFGDGGNLGYSLRGFNGAATIGKSSDVALSATTTLTVVSQGQNEAHPNYQPGRAVYYIMYIPA